MYDVPELKKVIKAVHVERNGELVSTFATGGGRKHIQKE